MLSITHPNQTVVSTRRNDAVSRDVLPDTLDLVRESGTAEWHLVDPTPRPVDGLTICYELVGPDQVTFIGRFLASDSEHGFIFVQPDIPEGRSVGHFSNSLILGPDIDELTEKFLRTRSETQRPFAELSLEPKGPELVLRLELTLGMAPVKDEIRRKIEREYRLEQ
jgi:hypothetical protein